MSKRTLRQDLAAIRADILVEPCGGTRYAAMLVRGSGHAVDDSEQAAAARLARQQFGEHARVRDLGHGRYLAHFNAQEVPA